MVKGMSGLKMDCKLGGEGMLLMECFISEEIRTYFVVLRFVDKEKV